jgi:uncharacterized protein
MTRLLFWIALVILVVAAIRSKLRAAMARAQGPSAGPAPASGSSDAKAKAWSRVEDQSETMLCCAHCGVYFPASEAVRADGRDYCGTAHAREAHQQAR